MFVHQWLPYVRDLWMLNGALINLEGMSTKEMLDEQLELERQRMGFAAQLRDFEEMLSE
jgi:hypothetical protein